MALRGQRYTIILEIIIITKVSNATAEGVKVIDKVDSAEIAPWFKVWF